MGKAMRQLVARLPAGLTPDAADSGPFHILHP